MPRRRSNVPVEYYAAAITALNAAHYADEVSFYSRPYLRDCERHLSDALHAPRRVLDVGCGAGRVLGALPKSLQAAGIDINWEAVATATASGNTRNALNASMASLPFADDSFDEVWCLRFSFNALPTNAIRLRALQEFWRVCAPNGRILVELFNWYNWGRCGLLRAGNILELASRRLQYLGSGRSARLPDRDIIYLANKVDYGAPGYAHLTHRDEMRSLAHRAGYGEDTVLTSESSLLSGSRAPVPRHFRQYSMWLSANKAVK
jgi:SAM-dependent methyltransferase